MTDAKRANNKKHEKLRQQKYMRVNATPEEAEILTLLRKTGKLEKIKEIIIKDAANIQLDAIEKEDALAHIGQIPEGWVKDIQPYILPAEDCKILCLCDAHIPSHDKDKLQRALLYGKEQQCDTLLWNGDVCDNYSVSRFTKSPKGPSLQVEMDVVKYVLELAGSPKFHKWKRKIFKIGNHDDRIDTLMKTQAPELYEAEGDYLRKRLGLSEMGYDLVLSKQLIYAGKLTILHGHEIKAGGSVSPARNKMLRAFENILFGHHHTAQSGFIRSIRKEVKGSWAVGGLMALSQEYDPYNQYVQGFAVVDVEKSGNFVVHNKIFKDGHIFNA